MIVNQAALAGIYRSFKTIFNQAFDEVSPIWPQVAMRVPSTARSNDYKWLGSFPAMREWVGDRVIKDLAAHGYEIVNKSFEATVAVNRDDIEDDQIGLYTPMVQGLAQSAKQHPDVLLFSLLKQGFSTTCYDGQYFFDTDHPVGGSTVSNSGGGTGAPWFLLDLSRPIRPLIVQIRKEPEFVAVIDPNSDNVFKRKDYYYGVDDRKNVGFGLWQLAYGSKQDLTAANYDAARAAMMSFKNDEGQPLGIKPTHLVYGPSLDGAARKLIAADRLDNGATNPWYNTVELIPAPWLA